MTYLASGGILDPLPIFETICFREADAKTQDMFAKRQEVRNNWNPTGTFTPDDLERLVWAAFDMMKDAGQQVIDKALADPQLPGARAELHAARDAIFDQEAKHYEFIQAVKAARAQGITQITALGLKRWIIGAMEVTQAAVFVTAKVACQRPWWLDILVAVLKVFNAAADFIISIPGIIYDATKKALEVVDQIAKIIKWSVIAGVGVGAWWIWNKYLKKKR